MDQTLAKIQQPQSFNQKDYLRNKWRKNIWKVLSNKRLSQQAHKDAAFLEPKYNTLFEQYIGEVGPIGFLICKYASNHRPHMTLSQRGGGTFYGLT